MRDVVSGVFDWDEPLPPEIETKWRKWLDSLCDLKFVEVPRSLFNVSIAQMSQLELHIFSDASEKAIAAVVFLVGLSINDIKYTSFVL